MTQSSGRAGKRVVLRYEDDWRELRAQLDADRTIGLAPSAVRDGVVRWLDADSFVEVGTLVRRDASSYRGGDDIADRPATAVPADGLIAGWGRTGGRLVFVSADDADLGGSIRGGAAASKATRIRRHALEQSRPLVQVFAAGRVEPEAFIGAEFVRFGYGVDLDFERLSLDRILKIGIVTGPLVDQAAIEAGWCHLTLLAGPHAALHGFRGHEALRRGFADLLVADLDAALAVADRALAHLPASRFEGPPPAEHATDESSPDATGGLLDRGWAYELAPDWRPWVTTRLGSVGGWPIGLIECSDGCRLDGATTEKMARLAHFCRTFRLPLVIDHGGLDRPAEPAPSDVEGWRRLGSVLRSSDTMVLELARGDRRLADDLGARPIWTAGPDTTGRIDVVVEPGGFRDATIEALPVLRPPRPRPDQDPRVRRRPPRTLQGE